MTAVLVALGLVCVVEGLVLALAPGRIEDLMRALSELPVDTRRALGLAAMAAGVAMIWLAGGVPV
jgi:uncharacterized protein YjeT (DUF2065 family)